MGAISPHILNIVVHVTAGATGLAIGLVPLLTFKGGVTHRRWGRWFVGFACISVAAALIGIALFHPPTALVAVTIAATYQLVGSLRALSLKHPPGWIDVLIAVAALGACGALVYFMGPGTANWTPAIGYSTLAYVGLIAVYDLSRLLWGRAWLAHGRPLDHGLKMTGVYFGMLSAGAGNLLRGLTLESVIPSMVGMAVMALLAVAWIVRDRKGRALA